MIPMASAMSAARPRRKCAYISKGSGNVTPEDDGHVEAKAARPPGAIMAGEVAEGNAVVEE